MAPSVEIHVYLLDEGVDVWRPVQAEPLGEGIYRIVSANPEPEDEIWQFVQGDVVRCERKELMDGSTQVTRLVAVDKFIDLGNA